MEFRPREGVIIDYPQKDLFHDPRDVIITSWMAVSDLADNDNVVPLAVQILICEIIDTFEQLTLRYYRSYYSW